MSTETSALVSLIQAGDLEKLRAALDVPGAKKLLNRSSPDGEYPIHTAARSQRPKIVELLLLAGASPNQESEEKGNHLGYTAAHHAAANGDIETLQILDRFKADFNRSSVDRWTPLHVAAFKGRMSVMAFLVGKGVDVNCTNNFGQPPILFAINHGRVADVRFLIKNKADLKFKDLNNDTLLHHAFHFQMAKMFEGQYDLPDAQLDVAVTLVLNGVPPSEQNLDGQVATLYLMERLPSLSAVLGTLYAHRDKLLESSKELNYLTLVSAKLEHFRALDLEEDASKALCQQIKQLEAERLTRRKGKKAAPAAEKTTVESAASEGTTIPAGHPPISMEALRSGEDPSGGKCPFFQNRNCDAATAHTSGDDKALSPLSWAFVCRHQTTILLACVSFVMGMWTDQMLDRVLPKK